ncbi:type II toxin-antitoxin system Phd/YefM family antitoxin (plasmid) [Aliirhizobium terrae]|uniref:type II toxin-antitoxin system Phd/YefM family antitoxin n=1 Tax=Terrirhizobium terrae TaxID=2926709 RepID=UPI0025756689|nr:type II toxin-antitoxin system Phd/YefM family antitoxin [Rhizobium sp. CC-CFT758]WJH38403.1 type II toxin-antitoxin system Phd/YefM family antitoxin [Rhizobium sp. CC-CFT758]
MSSTLSSAAFSKNPGACLDAALREPVVITKRGRPHLVLIAYEEYLRLIGRDRRVDLTAALGDEELAAIDEAEIDGTLAHLDTELLIEKYPADQS